MTRIKNGFFFSFFFFLAVVSLVLGTGFIITRVFYPYHNLVGCLHYILFVILMCFPFIYRAFFSVLRKNRAAFTTVGTCLLVCVVSLAAVSPDDYLSSSHDQAANGNPPLLTLFENFVVELWMPVHKSISRFMSGTRLPWTGDYLISENQLKSAAELLEPADIIFMRKNWYLSNMVTKGFWKHTAVYVGDLPGLDDYFLEECRSRFGTSLSEYVRKAYPQVYSALDFMSKNGKPSIVEAVADGVSLRPLIKSARSDSLAVIRTHLARKAKLDVLLYTFANYGKPYDFRFDYSTDSVFYCSELVSKAFAALGPEGIFFKIPISSGRPLLEPNDIMESFGSWQNSCSRQGDLIIYLTNRKGARTAQEMKTPDFRVSLK